jgi:DNA-binding beta-propeller fold protein YncE
MFRMLASLLFLFVAPAVASADVLVIASNAESRVTLVDPATGRELARLPTGPGPHEVAVSPDGRFAYVADAGIRGGAKGRTITVVDLVNRAIRTAFDLGEDYSPHDVRVSEDGTRVWVACAPAKGVLEVDTGTGEILKKYTTGREGGWMLAVSPDERTIFVAHLEVGGISIVDRASGSTRLVETPPGAIGLDVSPDGARLWFTNANTNEVGIVDPASGRLVATFDARGVGAGRVKLTPDGKTVVVVNDTTKSLEIFDATTRAFGGSIALPVEPKIVAISPDGRRAVVTSPPGDRAVLVDLVARRVTAEIASGKTPDGVGWARQAPPYRSRAAFSIPERDLVPEGIAHDPVTDAFFVSSTNKRKIVRVDGSGRVTDFTSEAQDGLLGVVGMRVDAKRRVLWALCGDAGENMPMRGLDASSEGRSGAFAYDLRTGRLRVKYLLENTPEKHFLNDLTIDAQGTVYASDSRAGAILTFSVDRKPEIFVPRVSWPNGISLSDDERRLFVATPDGVVAIDVRTKSITPISTPDGEVVGADGLYYYRGGLVAVQPWKTGRVIARYVLDRSHSRIERVEVVEGNHPAFLQPSTGVVVGDTFYYLANSQLQHFRKLWSQSKEVPLDRLRDVVVLRVKL